MTCREWVARYKFIESRKLIHCGECSPRFSAEHCLVCPYAYPLPLGILRDFLPCATCVAYFFSHTENARYTAEAFLLRRVISVSARLFAPLGICREKHNIVHERITLVSFQIFEGKRGIYDIKYCSKR